MRNGRKQTGDFIIGALKGRILKLDEVLFMKIYHVVGVNLDHGDDTVDLCDLDKGELEKRPLTYLHGASEVFPRELTHDQTREYYTSLPLLEAEARKA